jgi:hypothetical protein
MVLRTFSPEPAMRLIIGILPAPLRIERLAAVQDLIPSGRAVSPEVSRVWDTGT